MKLNKNAIVSSALHCDKCGAEYGIRLPDTYEEYQARLLALVGWKCREIARAEGRDSDRGGVLLNIGGRGRRVWRRIPSRFLSTGFSSG
jgi:hypothetical protein